MPPPSAKPGLTVAGVVVGFVGFLVAAYAWTGSRAYEIAYLYVGLAGAFLMVAGVGVGGYGRAMKGDRPRGRKAKASKASGPSDAKAESAPAKPLKARAAAALERLKPPSPGEAPSLESSDGELWPASLRSDGGTAAGAVAIPVKEPASSTEGDGKVGRGRRFAYRRGGRKKKAASTSTAGGALSLEHDGGELWPSSLRPGGVTADGAQRFELKCPECAVVFPVEGVPPLEVRCPGCGVSGTVE